MASYTPSTQTHLEWLNEGILILSAFFLSSNLTIDEAYSLIKALIVLFKRMPAQWHVIRSEIQHEKSRWLSMFKHHIFVRAHLWAIERLFIIRPNTIRSYLYALKVFLRSVPRNSRHLAIVHITTQFVISFLWDSGCNGKSSSTISCYISAIAWLFHNQAWFDSTVFNRQGHMLVLLLAVPSSKKLPFTPDMFAAWLHVIDICVYGDRRDFLVLYLAFISGGRIMEVASLEWKYVNFIHYLDETVLEFSLTIDKTSDPSAHLNGSIGSGEGITNIVDLVWNHMIETSYEEEYVFPGKGGQHISYSSCLRICKKMAESIGLDPTKYGTHSCRAGFATTALKNGASLTQVGHSARWKRFETIQNYNRCEQNDQIELSKMMQSLVKQKVDDSSYPEFG